jgi:hypothetical protein
LVHASYSDITHLTDPGREYDGRSESVLVWEAVYDILKALEEALTAAGLAP